MIKPTVVSFCSVMGLTLLWVMGVGFETLNRFRVVTLFVSSEHRLVVTAGGSQ